MRLQTRLGQLLERAAGDPLGVDRKKLSAGQAERQLDDLPAHPDVALQHLGWQVPQGFLEDVLAGRPTGGAARDHALEALEAGACLLLDRLAGGQRRTKAFNHGLGLAEALAHLCRLGLLGEAARVEPAAQLGHLADLAVRATDQRPDEGADPGHGRQHTYKEKGEQEFEQRHVGDCSPERGYIQAC